MFKRMALLELRKQAEMNKDISREEVRAEYSSLCTKIEAEEK